MARLVFCSTAHTILCIMRMLIKYLCTAAAVALTIYLVPGVSVAGGWPTILLVALVWSIIVGAIRPVLRILTLPITFLTLGLSSLIINTLLFWAMTFLIPGFIVGGFLSAVLGATVLSFFSWIIHHVTAS